jgi:hypothetical protein
VLALDLAVVPADAARSHYVPAAMKTFEERAEERETSSLEQLSRPAHVNAGTAWQLLYEQLPEWQEKEPFAATGPQYS